MFQIYSSMYHFVGEVEYTAIFAVAAGSIKLSSTGIFV
jgi:hypothetical protein